MLDSNIAPQAFGFAFSAAAAIDGELGVMFSSEKPSPFFDIAEAHLILNPANEDGC
jgi:hypothetical protein